MEGDKKSRKSPCRLLSKECEYPPDLALDHKKQNQTLYYKQYETK